ncbi:DUF6612 family protein [Sporosarcina sp. USHLN248]|uniref:DUF6612 family protein n=1 Tax=Sporosarcina sp. USHLN248 TaxID=3081300 RepID=UPI003018EBE3
MKKFATWALAFVFALSFVWPSGTTFAKTDSMKLFIDGTEVEGYEQPFMSHGDVLIPVENLFSEAGFLVSKDAAGKVSATNSYVTVEFDAANGVISVNGEKADTPFPLTLKNYGNYVSGEFLSSLEEFEVTVSEDEQSVNVTTNRVQDVEAFLEKTAAADLNSFSAKMKIDQEMSGFEEGPITMKMDMDMKMTDKPIALHMKQSLSMKADELDEAINSETYLTEEGYFQNDGDQWVKYPSEMTEMLFDESLMQIDPTAQMELLKATMKGIHVFEYDDVYVMTQTISNDEFSEIMKEAMSLISDMLPADMISVETTEGTSEEATEEAAEVVLEDEKVEAVEEDEQAEQAVADESEDASEAVEENTSEEATEEDVTDEATEEDVIIEEEIDLESILDMIQFNIENFFIVTTIDKDTFFPISTTGNTQMTITVDGETITLKQVIEGTFSDYNQVKEIKIPAEVINSAIDFEEYLEALEAEFEQEAA